jgi:hypothetical protein
VKVEPLGGQGLLKEVILLISSVVRNPISKRELDSTFPQQALLQLLLPAVLEADVLQYDQVTVEA